MTPLLALVTVSLGTLVLVVAAVRGFAVHWLPTGSVLLLYCSSGLVPVGAGDPGDAGEAEARRTEDIKILRMLCNVIDGRQELWKGSS